MNDTTRSTNTGWTPDQEEEQRRREVAHSRGGRDDMLLGVNRVTSSRADLWEPGQDYKYAARGDSGNLSDREAGGPDSARGPSEVHVLAAGEQRGAARAGAVDPKARSARRCVRERASLRRGLPVGRKGKTGNGRGKGVSRLARRMALGVARDLSNAPWKQRRYAVARGSKRRPRGKLFLPTLSDSAEKFIMREELTDELRGSDALRQR
ncbi:hypothetical protein MTO96_049650 [Rhipicephalus appendiculatus]